MLDLNHTKSRHQFTQFTKIWFSIFFFDFGLNQRPFFIFNFVIFVTAHDHVACNTRIKQLPQHDSYNFPFPFHTLCCSLLWKRAFCVDEAGFKWATHNDAIKTEHCVTGVSTYSMARLNHPYIFISILSFCSVKVKAIF